jgi:hypothetical protein
MEAVVQDLKGLLQFLIPLALFLAVMLLRGYLRRSAESPDGETIRVPPEAPTPAPVHSALRSEVSSVEGRPELPREPEASQSPRRREQVLDRFPAKREPLVSGTRRRLRRLLAQPEGRRVALLVHEVFRPPGGCGRDETRRQLD